MCNLSPRIVGMGCKDKKMFNRFWVKNSTYDKLLIHRHTDLNESKAEEAYKNITSKYIITKLLKSNDKKKSLKINKKDMLYRRTRMRTHFRNGTSLKTLLHFRIKKERY